MRRVLVTRPEPGASATAERLTAMGFFPVILPLTEIVPVLPDALPDPDRWDAVAATSANALRHAPPSLLAGLTKKPLFAVGDGTAAFARQAGFRYVRSASGTAADLAGLIEAEARPGARILHLAGADRTAGFEEALRDAGFGIDIVETYRAEKVSYSTDFLSRMLGGDPIWSAPVFSARAGELLAELVRRMPSGELFENTWFFCISEKAAAPLRALAGGRVAVSDEPSEAAVLALLSSQG